MTILLSFKDFFQKYFWGKDVQFCGLTFRKNLLSEEELNQSESLLSEHMMWVFMTYVQ